MRYSIDNTNEWRHWVTPTPARDKEVHRWYLFPHSFTSDLVQALIGEWHLSTKDRILDPFAGAGTTLLASKEAGVPSTGYDLSPLAVFVSNTKIAHPSKSQLLAVWRKLKSNLRRYKVGVVEHPYPDLIRRALPDGRLEAFDTISSYIDRLRCSKVEKDFFRLALIALIPRFSHAKANGGWLRWLNEGAESTTLLDAFKERVEMMLSDIPEGECADAGNWKACISDARTLPDADGTYSAVITSPPYPNRHDYTRVFGVELMFGFLDWEQNRALRYQSFHSHPEARPERPMVNGEYQMPKSLEAKIRRVSDPRIQKMLHGYFLDMFLCLREVTRVCKKGAKVAFVVGNARYNGNVILVDELTAEIGEQAGLVCQEIRGVRWRGNSAQQMGKFGRVASRESVVIFEKPKEPRR